MQIGNGAWVAGWTSFSVLLAFVASLVGPGPVGRPSEPVEMVRIAPGPFTMGSEVDSDDERPAHTLEPRAFEINRLPVVDAQLAVRYLEFSRVGSYPAGATPDGILDMAGNARQRTGSLYRSYPYRADDGREAPNAPGERVSRGGGRSSSAEMLRSTYRNVAMTTVQSARPPITLRCARDAES